MSLSNPGSPKGSEAGPGHIVVHDSQDKPLLVSVSDPSRVALLPVAEDYFVDKHRLNKREFVSSPELGLMMYAPCFDSTRKSIMSIVIIVRVKF